MGPGEQGIGRFSPESLARFQFVVRNLKRAMRKSWTQNKKVWGETECSIFWITRKGSCPKTKQAGPPQTPSPTCGRREPLSGHPEEISNVKLPDAEGDAVQMQLVRQLSFPGCGASGGGEKRRMFYAVENQEDHKSCFPTDPTPWFVFWVFEKQSRLGWSQRPPAGFVRGLLSPLPQ